MKSYDLYGFSEEDLEAAKLAVETALDIILEAHESSYHCGDYFRHGNTGEENFVLQRNFDPLEREWSEGDFQDAPVLLYVSDTNRGDEIKKRLLEEIANISLLRHELL